jgi:ATP adenylyltransferase
MAEKSILAPWRSEFILGKKEKGCIFCRLAKETKPSFDNLIVYRAERTFVVMNRYPYTGGHLLVVPRRHIGVLERLTEQESAELIRICQLSVKAMKRSLRPEAFNLGMNLGRPAGAGLPRHLHMHIVPRWTGDSNFMSVVGDTRVHSIPMDRIYASLVKGFAQV